MVRSEWEGLEDGGTLGRVGEDGKRVLFVVRCCIVRFSNIDSHSSYDDRVTARS